MHNEKMKKDTPYFTCHVIIRVLSYAYLRYKLEIQQAYFVDDMNNYNIISFSLLPISIIKYIY